MGFYKSYIDSGTDLGFEDYYKAICQMKRDIYLGRYDSIGFKRCIYKLVDFITPKYFFCFESVSYYQKISKEVSDSYLNVSKIAVNGLATNTQMYFG